MWCVRYLVESTKSHHPSLQFQICTFFFALLWPVLLLYLLSRLRSLQCFIWWWKTFSVLYFFMSLITVHGVTLQWAFKCLVKKAASTLPLLWQLGLPKLSSSCEAWFALFECVSSFQLLLFSLMRKSGHHPSSRDSPSSGPAGCWSQGPWKYSGKSHLPEEDGVAPPT